MLEVNFKYKNSAFTIVLFRDSLLPRPENEPNKWNLETPTKKSYMKITV